MAYSENSQLQTEMKCLEQENMELEKQFEQLQSNQASSLKQALQDSLKVIEDNEKNIDNLQHEILVLEYDKTQLEEHVSNLQSQAFQLFNNQENPQQNTQLQFFQIPSTVDQRVPRVSCLKSIEENSDVDLQTLKSIKNKFCQFRQFRPDGNQYYRAVGFALLESLITTTNLQQVEEMCSRFKNAKGQFENDQKYQSLRTT